MKSGSQQGNGYMHDQKVWIKYFVETKLHLVDVRHNGETLKVYDAIWRTGSDRCDVRSTNEITEASNNVLSATMVRVATAFHPAQDVHRRPTFIEAIPRLQTACQTAGTLYPHSTTETTSDFPTKVTPAILQGHASIKKHSLRWDPAAFFCAGTESMIYEETRGPYRYFVMSAQRAALTDTRPPVVDPEAGRHAVDFVTLQPSSDRNEDWLLAHGYLAQGGRLSWTRLNAILDLAIVRVDTRLLDACKTSPYQWIRAVICERRCDENANHRCCEHCIAARHILHDPACDLRPSILHAVPLPGRPPLPQQLSCRDRDVVIDSQARADVQAAPNSPSQRPTAAEELRAEEYRRSYNEMRKCVDALRRPPASFSICITTRSGKKVALLDGGRAIRLLAELRASIEYLRVQRQAEWNWDETSTTLGIPGVLGCYARHPNSIISGRAYEAIDALRRCLHLSRIGASNLDPSIGRGRCASQRHCRQVIIYRHMVQRIRASFKEAPADGSRCCLLLGQEPLPSDLANLDGDSKPIKVTVVVHLAHTNDALDHADSFRISRLTPCGVLFWASSMEPTPTHVQSFETIRNMVGALSDGFLCFILSPTLHSYTCSPLCTRMKGPTPSATSFEPVCFVDFLDGVPAGVSFAPRSVAEFSGAPGSVNQSALRRNATIERTDAPGTPNPRATTHPESLVGPVSGAEIMHRDLECNADDRQFAEAVRATLRTLVGGNIGDLANAVHERIGPWFPRSLGEFRTAIDSIIAENSARATFDEQGRLRELLAMSDQPCRLIDHLADGDCFFRAADGRLRAITGFSLTVTPDVKQFRERLAGRILKLQGTALGGKIEQIVSHRRSLQVLATETAADGMDTGLLLGLSK